MIYFLALYERVAHPFTGGVIRSKGEKPTHKWVGHKSVSKLVLSEVEGVRAERYLTTSLDTLR